jgi:hypothetical protein
MRRISLTIFASLTLFAILFSAAASAEARERHPQIRKAINVLERARVDLQDARHIYCGHRAEALEATNAAIQQLRLALQYDRASNEPARDTSNVAYTTAAYKATSSDRYPLIHQAINALQAARNDLEHAAHDFGGHRVDAIRACDAALSQLRQAISCANEERRERRR